MSLLQTVAASLVLGGILLFLHAYLAYPAALWILGRLKWVASGDAGAPGELPHVTITVPVHNEGHQVGALIQNLLHLDYPAHRRQILIVSDASSDGTDEIVRGFAAQGVELLRVEERGGKSLAENAALPHLRGDIVVNTDASIRFPAESLQRLVSVFSDPGVGLASGRDVSVGAGSEDGGESNLGESGYVGYEMAIRSLETRVSGIVGASGCYYAIRKELHAAEVPAALSRDFAAALNTWEGGFRPVSVPEAVCWVPRTTSIRREYGRKVRTITRGMDTLRYKKALLNPLRFPIPAWMLLSHKICRWALPWAGILALAGLAVLALSYPWAAGLLALGILFLVLAWIGWFLDRRRPVPRAFAIPAFLVAGNLAAAHAFVRFVRGVRVPVWEPTRRGLTK